MWDILGARDFDLVLGKVKGVLSVDFGGGRKMPRGVVVLGVHFSVFC